MGPNGQVPLRLGLASEQGPRGSEARARVFVASLPGRDLIFNWLSSAHQEVLGLG